MVLAYAAPSAAARPAVDSRLLPDLVIAASYWKAAPNCEHGLELVREPLSHGYDALAEPPCRVAIDPRVLKRTAVTGHRATPQATRAFRESLRDLRRRQDAGLCILIVHEYGHLLGHGHVADPGNVMYPAPDPRSVPACARMLRRR